MIAEFDVATGQYDVMAVEVDDVGVDEVVTADDVVDETELLFTAELLSAAAAALIFNVAASCSK